MTHGTHNNLPGGHAHDVCFRTGHLDKFLHALKNSNVSTSQLGNFQRSFWNLPNSIIKNIKTKPVSLRITKKDLYQIRKAMRFARIGGLHDNDVCHEVRAEEQLQWLDHIRGHFNAPGPFTKRGVRKKIQHKISNKKTRKWKWANNRGDCCPFPPNCMLKPHETWQPSASSDNSRKNEKWAKKCMWNKNTLNSLWMHVLGGHALWIPTSRCPTRYAFQTLKLLETPIPSQGGGKERKKNRETIFSMVDFWYLLLHWWGECGPFFLREVWRNRVNPLEKWNVSVKTGSMVKIL